MSIVLHHGDALDILRTLPDASIDAVVTDPPYGLAEHRPATIAAAMTAWCSGDRDHVPDQRGFMGRAWDGFVPPPAVWDECLRVLKPGGHLLAFAGSRTADLMGIGVRLAGFEIRDTITWHYGSGFPKSRDVSKDLDRMAGAEREVVSEGRPLKRMIPGADQDKTGSWIKDNGREFVPTVTAPATDAARQWSGWGTALKPASEPIIIARKPLTGTVAANVLQWGTGALSIDGCRVAHASAADLAESQGKNPGRDDVVTSEVYGAGRPQQSVNTSGRWPSNAVFTHAPCCGPDEAPGECAPGCPVAELDAQSEGTRAAKPSTGGKGTASGRPGGRGIYGAFDRAPNAGANAGGLGDSGTASRFFPTFRHERNEHGCVAGCPVAELDAQSEGTRAAKPSGTGSRSHAGEGWGMGAMAAPQKFMDSGGASRFFPTFRYQAKAPSRERPKVDGVAHPTVKPLALCKWLVRLVTPPGGLVLDPFAGSGTTLQAARDEGFTAIGIEREASYLPLIRLRLGEGVEVVTHDEPEPEPEPVDPVLAAIHEAELTRGAFNALHREHRLVWTDAHTAAARARLDSAGVSHR